MRYKKDGASCCLFLFKATTHSRISPQTQAGSQKDSRYVLDKVGGKDFIWGRASFRPQPLKCERSEREAANVTKDPAFLSISGFGLRACHRQIFNTQSYQSPIHHDGRLKIEPFMFGWLTTVLMAMPKTSDIHKHQNQHHRVQLKHLFTWLFVSNITTMGKKEERDYAK